MKNTPTWGMYRVQETRTGRGTEMSEDETKRNSPSAAG